MSDGLEELKEDAFQILNEVVKKAFEMAIDSKNINDLINDDNLAEIEFNLKDGRSFSYSSAFKFFIRSVPDENKRLDYIDRINENLDDYLNNILEKTDNNYEKTKIILKVNNYSNRLNNLVSDDMILFSNPTFTLEKFGNCFIKLKETEREFNKMLELISFNSTINSTSIDEIIKRIQNKESNEDFKNKLDFLSQIYEEVIKSKITNAIQNPNFDLNNLDDNKVLEDIDLVVQKWQQIQEKIEKDNINLDQDFKDKLNNTIDNYKSVVIRVAGECVNDVFKEKNNSNKQRKDIAKISTIVDILVDNSRIKGVFNSNHLDDTTTDPQAKKFYQENIKQIGIEKANIMNELNKNKGFSRIL